MLASNEGHAETMKVLLEHGANVCDRANNGSTSLKFARKRKHSEVIKILRQYSDNGHLGFIKYYVN